jgi:hypothetical protein
MLRSQVGRQMHIPLWLKWSFTGLLGIWVIVYWRGLGPQNFLWFCDLANFLVGIALWLEKPLLLSSQAVSVLLVQGLWVVDVLGRAITGSHPIGGTEYMFDDSLPLGLRLFSLFHVIVPGLVIWAVWRLGYDRRGWILQTAIAWAVLPICFLFTSPVHNINWVWGPFGKPQLLVEPALYLFALMIAYPVVLYFPTHLFLQRLFPAVRSLRPDSGEPPLL